MIGVGIVGLSDSVVQIDHRLWNEIFMLAELDDKYQIITVNALMQSLIDDSFMIERLKGMPLELFLHPFSLKEKRLVNWRIVIDSVEQEGQWSGFMQYVTVTSRNITLFATIKRLPSGGFYFIAQDRTKQAAEFSADVIKMRELTFMREAFDAASIIAITDADGIITYVNDRFCEISKYDRKDLIGNPHSLIRSGNQPLSLFDELWATIRQGKVWRGELENRTKDGNIFWMKTTIVPFFNEENEPYQFVLINSDITDRVIAEAELAQAMSNDFRRTIKSLHNCIFKVKLNEDGEIVFTLSEGKLAEQLDMSTENVEGKLLREVWKVIYDEVGFYYEQAFQGNGGQFEIQHEGRFFLVSLSPVIEDDKVQEVVASMIEITKRKKAEELIRYMAHYDSLTTLPNRLSFTNKLKTAIEQATEKQSGIALLFIDLDRFKTVNDTMGHAKGDELLKQVANRLNLILPKRGYVSRQGGDEFILFLEEADREQAAKLATTIVKQLSAPFVLDEVEVYVSPSIGISMFPDNGLEMEQLLKCADAAMYHAKEEQKNHYCFFDEELHHKISRRLELERDLRKAVGNGELELWYQPKVNLSTSQLIGVEALLRWNHPIHGLVAPGMFIHIAEETNLITSIGEWVLREACRQMKEWLDAGLDNISVAVNISFQQFADQDFPELVDKILKETGLSPHYLELEITESIAQNARHAISVLTKIKELGVSVSIDDFGTGYSSLSSLSQFPIDALKIDQSFVRNLNENNQAIIRSIIDIANHMNITVIAEGVETLEHVLFLQRYNCLEAQGYYYSKPLPKAVASQYIVDALN